MPDPDVPEGLDALRGRLARRSRDVPPPRHPRPPATGTASIRKGQDPPSGVYTAPVSTAPVSLPSPPPMADTESALQQPTAVPRHLHPTSRGGDHPVPGPDEPSTNLAIRVRRSLDFRLGDLVHELRREGVRSSKVELVELLLWELPAAVTPELRERLRNFRTLAPRQDRQ